MPCSRQGVSSRQLPLLFAANVSLLTSNSAYIKHHKTYVLMGKMAQDVGTVQTDCGIVPSFLKLSGCFVGIPFLHTQLKTFSTYIYMQLGTVIELVAGRSHVVGSDMRGSRLYWLYGISGQFDLM